MWTSEAVVVVSGLPRSGTSMMMQMLAAGGVAPLTDGERQPDDDNPRGYFELEAVKRTRQDAGWLEQARGRAVKVVHALLADLPAGPAYRVILMQRPLAQVLASQQAMLRRLGRRPAPLSDAQLAAVYRRQLEDVRARVLTRPGFCTLEVDFLRCVEDPAAVAAAVEGFLGGLDQAAMAAAVAPGLWRQRAAEPPGGKPGWRTPAHPGHD